MENLFDRELRDRHRKAKYALMMQLDWMSTTVTEQDEAIKQRLLKIMRILEGEEWASAKPAHCAAIGVVMAKNYVNHATIEWKNSTTYGYNMSKGSKYRPVNKSKFDENFDKIFGEKTMDPVMVDLNRYLTAQEEAIDAEEAAEEELHAERIDTAMRILLSDIDNFY